MKLSTLIIIAAAPALAACQSTPVVPDLPADSVLTREAVERMFPPILLSRNDTLTVGTQAQVADHNKRVWCEFPDTRPGNFDASVCPK